GPTPEAPSRGERGVAPDIKREAAPRPADNPSAVRTQEAPQAPVALAIAHAEPAEPEAGGSLTVQLKGNPPKDAPLSYRFRTDPEGAWQPAPDGRISLTQLKEGEITLQAQALDSRGQVCDAIKHTWTVKAKAQVAAAVAK